MKLLASKPTVRKRLGVPVDGPYFAEFFPVCEALGLPLLWHVADFGWFFFAVANVTGAVMVLASLRLVRNMDSKDSWRLYKISSFPYLGVIFLAMCLNFWI